MIALFQKVKSAKIYQSSNITNSIGDGVLIYLGIESKDTVESVHKMIDKVLNTRIIPDDEGRMTNTLSQTKQAVMIISQFTLCADLSEKKPTFINAKTAFEAKEFYLKFVNLLKQSLPEVVSGPFGDYLQISSINDGPVNFILNV